MNVLFGLMLFLAPEGCLNCHGGIEEMHPKFALTCTQCHGGDPRAATKEEAHVRPSKPVPNDERTLPLEGDLAWLRFQNPSNMRVVGETCATCHADEVDHLEKSLHGTTSGHLSDGLYENGVSKKKDEAYAIFKTGKLEQIPAFRPKTGTGSGTKRPPTIADHYLDLPRKQCMQCHIWSRGRAVRGRLGMDGDYRSEGCATCHVLYANDGLSRSADPTVNRLEPGHALKHEMTSKIPTDQCVHCHYGDASIGLNFRGLAQLVPGMPAGPDNPGTTKSRLNGTFYVQDPAIAPPDIHFERGMHCIDCHTFGDVMGTGETPTKMELAVEIECTDCHGTFEKRGTFKTQRGTRLGHVREEKGQFILRSKVDGKDHVVPQALEVLTPGHPRYNARAVAAMTPAHARLECYSCHAGWTPNFFGFHFDRNEQFTQLEILSGERTPGRVTTQEKVFATFRNMLFGWAPEGTVSPYMVGFSTMGTVHGKDGKKIVDQGMPRTAAGLSGMTLVHHQLHTNRPQARACVECHRNDEALGLGSPNFRLARDFAFATTERGLESIALDRSNLEKSLAVATLPLKGARDVALLVDTVDAHARLGIVAGEGGVAVVDLRAPEFPREIGSVKLDQAYDVEVRGTKAYVAAGADGLVVIDLERPDRPRIIGRAALPEDGTARRLALAGFYAFVLDGKGAGALAVLDLADPASPNVAARIAISDEGRDATAEEPGAVVTWWAWSKPAPRGKPRAGGRRMVAVATTKGLLHLVDATEPTAPRLLERARGPRFEKTSFRSIAYTRHYDLGSDGGGIPSVERDYLFLGGEEERGQQDRSYLVALDVTNPEAPQPRGRTRYPGLVQGLAVAHVYNPPFIQTFILGAGRQGGVVIDATRTDNVMVLAQLGGQNLRGFGSIAVEEMAFDRLVDWDGRPEKDISHPGARYFSRAEALRILRAPVPAEPPGTGTGTRAGRGAGGKDGKNP